MPPLSVLHIHPDRETYCNSLKVALELETPTFTAGNPSPSLAAMNRSILREAQLQCPIYNGLPPLADAPGPNIAIHYPKFAYMWHAFSNDEVLKEVKPSNNTMSIVARLHAELLASDIKDEEKYADIVQKYFKELFPGMEVVRKYTIMRGRKLHTELDLAVLCPTPYGVPAVFIVVETKLNSGLGGSAPTQGIYGYRRVCVDPRVRKFIHGYTCPILTSIMHCTRWSPSSTGHLIPP